jgi:hypothetical protein
MVQKRKTFFYEHVIGFHFSFFGNFEAKGAQNGSKKGKPSSTNMS